MEDAAVAEVPSDVTKFMQQVISENNDLPTSNSTVQFVDTFEAPLLQDNLVSTQPDDTEIDHGEKTNKVHTRDSPVNLLDLDDFVTAGNSDPNTNSRRNNVCACKHLDQTYVREYVIWNAGMNLYILLFFHCANL